MYTYGEALVHDFAGRVPNGRDASTRDTRRDTVGVGVGSGASVLVDVRGLAWLTLRVTDHEDGSDGLARGVSRLNLLQRISGRGSA
jgi:hypothetical protein